MFLKLKKIVVIAVILFLCLATIYHFRIAITSPLFRYYASFFSCDVTIYGDVNVQDGIGGQSVEVYELLKNDFSVQILTDKLSNKSELSSDLKDHIYGFGAYGKILIYEGVLSGEKAIKSIRKIKNRSNNIENQIWIAYSMFESSRLTEYMVKYLNDEFDMVVVPDQWLVQVYKDSGVIKPVFVLPLTVDYKNLINIPFRVKDENKIFTFGNLSSLSERKNQIRLIQAFQIVNKIYPDTHLVMNARFSAKSSKMKLLDFLENNKVDNLTIGYESLSEDEYQNLLDKIDAFVYPSMGEGFSIQPREAMAMGRPVIITNNTAQSTICDSGLVECVKSDIKVPACYDGWFKTCLGNYFDCNVQDLAEAMIKVYNNYNYYLSKSQAMRDWAKNYTRDNLRKKYINIVKPKKLILGNKNEITDDYLMTSSINLYNKFIKLDNF